MQNIFVANGITIGSLWFPETDMLDAPIFGNFPAPAVVGFCFNQELPLPKKSIANESIGVQLGGGGVQGGSPHIERGMQSAPSGRHAP